jgi:hypothetical protein
VGELSKNTLPSGNCPARDTEASKASIAIKASLDRLSVCFKGKKGIFKVKATIKY